jgi:hypothetical protein
MQELFGRHGDVGRLVLPPTRVLALVEYLEASAARSAFRALAYRRLQHVPLYLEWAPAGIFAGPAAVAASAQVRRHSQAFLRTAPVLHPSRRPCCSRLALGACTMCSLLAHLSARRITLARDAGDTERC